MSLYLFRIWSYLTFYLKSGNAHGLHSPFVFNLYTKAIQAKITHPGFAEIEKQRQIFLTDDRILQVEDAGAGSVKMGNKRTVQEIAQNGISGFKKCEILFKLVDYLKPQSILELGTSLGISTSYLHLGNEKAELKSIEADSKLVDISTSHLNQKIKVHKGRFDEILPELFNTGFKPDFIYIDGDHNSESLIKYIELFLQNDEKDLVFVIDDIYWSRDMSKGWAKLIQDSRFGITIDLYHFGLLFTRLKQPKQHFYLRI